MGLINEVHKSGNQILQTYKSRRGNITHVLKTRISGVGTGTRIVNCDTFGNPQKVIDLLPGKRKDIYLKAPDGSTVMQKGLQFVKLAHVNFMSLCERVFK